MTTLFLVFDNANYMLGREIYSYNMPTCNEVNREFLEKKALEAFAEKVYKMVKTKLTFREWYEQETQNGNLYADYQLRKGNYAKMENR